MLFQHAFFASHRTLLHKHTCGSIDLKSKFATTGFKFLVLRKKLSFLFSKFSATPQLRKILIFLKDEFLLKGLDHQILQFVKTTDGECHLVGLSLNSTAKIIRAKEKVEHR